MFHILKTFYILVTSLRIRSLRHRRLIFCRGRCHSFLRHWRNYCATYIMMDAWVSPGRFRGIHVTICIRQAVRMLWQDANLALSCNRGLCVHFYRQRAIRSLQQGAVNCNNVCPLELAPIHSLQDCELSSGGLGTRVKGLEVWGFRV